MSRFYQFIFSLFLVIQACAKPMNPQSPEGHQLSPTQSENSIEWDSLQPFYTNFDHSRRPINPLNSDNQKEFPTTHSPDSNTRGLSDFNKTPTSIQSHRASVNVHPINRQFNTNAHETSKKPRYPSSLSAAVR